MKPLEPPDTHYLAAAEGWLELGNPAEALAELEHVPTSNWEHPWVLQMRWRVGAAANRHEECVRIASRLIDLLPEEPFGWVHRSYSLHEMKRTQEAYEGLASLCGKFPHDHVILYNLACYACQLGHSEEALEWLKKAAAVSGWACIKQMAADDPDLSPLAAEIQKLGG